MARNNGNSPYRPNTPANTDTSIHSAINGEDVPPVLRMSVAVVIQSIANAMSDPHAMNFFGAHKYDMKPLAKETPAKIADMSLTKSDEPILFTATKYAQK